MTDLVDELLEQNKPMTTPAQEDERGQARQHDSLIKGVAAVLVIGTVLWLIKKRM